MNCSKHARASSVAIRIDHHPQRIELSIKDDGVGFDTNPTRYGSRVPGLGLLSMRERAQAVGGTCRIESAPGHGTGVIVELPLG